MGDIAVVVEANVQQRIDENREGKNGRTSSSNQTEEQKNREFRFPNILYVNELIENALFNMYAVVVWLDD